MASWQIDLDPENHIVTVTVTEEDGGDYAYQFDFDPGTGRWEFSERDLLERDFSEEWVEELEEGVDQRIATVLRG